MRVQMDAIGRRTAFFGGAAVLAGCAGATPPQIQSDAQTIAAGVQSVLVDLEAVPGIHIPPATAAKIADELALLKSQAAALSASPSPGQPTVADFVNTVNSLAALIAPFYPEAPVVAAMVTAAASLAQVVLAESGAISAPRTRWTMPPGRARALLNAS